ncbi:MAG: hypothetical protein EOP09_03070 [Proteobacteria bacterium]|nr:MAG: hypothetical protein EOP09_03070 [Pseudomonadota bacterium]
MLGKHNRKEQALALTAGNGILLLQLISFGTKPDLLPAGESQGWGVMMIAAIAGLISGFVALSHAGPSAQDDESSDKFVWWIWGALVPLGFVLVMLLYGVYVTQWGAPVKP